VLLLMAVEVISAHPSIHLMSGDTLRLDTLRACCNILTAPGWLGPGFNKIRWYQSTFVCWGALAFIAHHSALLRKDDSSHSDQPITAWYHEMSRP
jgi:hypothetical protein